MLGVAIFTLLLVAAAWIWRSNQSGVAIPAPGEALSGGETTRDVLLLPSFREPAANLSLDRQVTFYMGRSLFRDVWLVPPTVTTARDGLGPVFNGRSCVGCHIRGGRGRPPESQDEPLSSMLVRLSLPGTDPVTGVVAEPTYGDQLQVFGITLTRDHGLGRENGALEGDGPVGEGRVAIDYELIPGQFGDGEPYELRQPLYEIHELAYGPMHPDTRVSPRVAPPLIGLGLLEAIPEEVLLAAADPDDVDGDGISGRPNRVWDVQAQRTVMGRFGLKANQPNLLQQTAAAFRNDIGITSRLYPKESCTAKQQVCLDAPRGNGSHTEYEIDDELLDATVYFTRLLAVPKRRHWDHPGVLHGRQLFREAGCTACHRAGFVTGGLEGYPELSGQQIWPYTDLLLHDMGEGLADGRSDYQASGREWRTPPLWGIGLTRKVSGHTRFLHDGRARNLKEAILWHGGEAAQARGVFVAMDRQDRDALIAFLNSL